MKLPSPSLPGIFCNPCSLPAQPEPVGLPWRGWPTLSGCGQEEQMAELGEGGTEALGQPVATSGAVIW